jgi:RecB family endonuclease NucS
MKFPYVFDFEWAIVIQDALHYGDLLFTDGANSFLCVETKSVEPTVFTASPPNKKTLSTKRHKSKKNAVTQTAKYVSALHKSSPHIVLTEGVVVTEREVQHVLTLSR